MPTSKILCDVFCNLVEFVQFKKREKHPCRSASFSKPATLLKVTLLDECFSRFLNCTNGTKLRKTSHYTSAKTHISLGHFKWMITKTFRTSNKISWCTIWAKYSNTDVPIFSTFYVKVEDGLVNNRNNKWASCNLAKACFRYFHHIFIFSTNDSPSKTMKNAFYFI